MTSTQSVTQAQSSLPGLIRKAKKGESVVIRRQHETVAYLVSKDRIEAIVETLELLSNPAAMTAIGEHHAAAPGLGPRPCFVLAKA